MTNEKKHQDLSELPPGPITSHEYQHLEQSIIDHNNLMVATLERLQADGMIRVDLGDLIVRFKAIKPLSYKQAEEDIEEAATISIETTHTDAEKPKLTRTRTRSSHPSRKAIPPEEDLPS